MEKEFIATECGWVSPKTPPTNHNNVIVLVWLIEEKLYEEIIGYYEHKEWQLDPDDTTYKIEGWFPYPYTPHNH